MIKAPIKLQDLRRRLYVKVKAEPTRVLRGLATAHLGSCFGPLGPITLAVKCAGTRSAGNPHATCDVAGAGNGASENVRATAPVPDPTSHETATR